MKTFSVLILFIALMSCSFASYVPSAVTTQGATRPVVYSWKIGTTGTVSSETGNPVSGNCTNASPSVCTFNSGVFGATPTCLAGADTSAGYWCNAFSESTSSVSITCTDSAGSTLLTIAKEVVCHGTAP